MSTRGRVPARPSESLNEPQRKELRGWLNKVFRGSKGFARFAYINRASKLNPPPFLQEFFEWPEQAPEALEWTYGAVELGYDLYFCPHLFTERRATKTYATPSRTVWADLDGCDPKYLGAKQEPPPTAVFASSPERWQAFWVLDEILEPEQISELNKRIYELYKPKGCDACWSLTHLMRLPYTYNHKKDPWQIIPILENKVPVSASLLDNRLPRLTGSRVSTLPQIRLDDMTKRRTLKSASEHESEIWWREVKEGERSEHLFLLASMLKRSFGFGDGAVMQALLKHPVFMDKFPDPELRKNDIQRILFKLRMKPLRKRVER